MSNPWHEVVRRLLKHFDENEGTTYLYDEGDRNWFIEHTDSTVREEVKIILNQYHEH